MALDMNDGRLPYKEFEKFKAMDFIKEDPKEIKMYKKKAEDLVQQVQFLNQEIEKQVIAKEVTNKRQEDDMLYKNYKDEIAFLKHQIE